MGPRGPPGQVNTNLAISFFSRSGARPTEAGAALTAIAGGSGGLGGTRRGLGAAGESRGPYIGRGEASGAHGRAPDQALMEGSGWAWHGHGASGAFMANHDEAVTQGDAVAHRAATRHGWRSRRGAQDWEEARACNLHDTSVITMGSGANGVFWPG